MELVRFIQYFTIAALVIVCLSSIIIIAKRLFKIKPLQFFTLYLIGSLVINIPALILGKLGSNNLPLLHLFTIWEFVLVGLFYRSNTSIRCRDIYKYILITGTVLLLVNSAFIQGMTEFNSYAKGFSQVILLLFSIHYLFQNSDAGDSETVELKSTLNLINGGLCVYFAGSLFIFMSSNFLLEMTDLLLKLFAINVILHFLFQVIVFYAVWKLAYPKIRSSP